MSRTFYRPKISPRRLLRNTAAFSIFAGFSGVYFSNKIERDAFPWQFYAQMCRSLDDTEPTLQSNSTLWNRTHAYLEHKYTIDPIKLNYLCMIAIAGFTNELWKNEIVFQLLSQLAYSYMKFMFLSEVNQNVISDGRMQVFYRGECNSTARMAHNRGASLVDLRDPCFRSAYGLPFVIDVTLVEGRGTDFVENDDDLTPGLTSGFTSRMISLTSHLPCAENFAGTKGKSAVSWIVPDVYICGAQHCCVGQVPLEEFEYMVPGFRHTSKLATAFYEAGVFKKLVFNKDFSGDMSKLVLGEEARPFVKSLPDTEPKKQMLLQCIKPEFDANAGFFGMLSPARRDHYHRTQEKLKRFEQQHPVQAMLRHFVRDPRLEQH